jgi:hypothetical protein
MFPHREVIATAIHFRYADTGVDGELRTLHTLERLHNIENNQILRFVGTTISVQQSRDSDKNGICAVDRLLNKFIPREILRTETATARRTWALR